MELDPPDGSRECGVLGGVARAYESSGFRIKFKSWPLELCKLVRLFNSRSEFSRCSSSSKMGGMGSKLCFALSLELSNGGVVGEDKLCLSVKGLLQASLGEVGVLGKSRFLTSLIGEGGAEVELTDPDRVRPRANTEYES